MALLGKTIHAMLFIFLLSFGGFPSVAATTTGPARFVTGVFSNALSALMKWLWSLQATSKSTPSSRPVVNFESGYTVETVFDGSKLGIEPFAVGTLPSGDLLILDSDNSNIYKISPPLSRYSRPKLIAGSAEGYSGHVDGRPRDARMNHPRGLTIDGRGNIYVADSMNMAIRKISDAGVTTVAGGKWGRGSHIDGPSEDAKFSDDFEVVYSGSSCSLVVVDRGNQAIREIQLNFDDCAYQYGTGFPLGVAVLVAAAFFGYMLALLQRRVGAIVSSKSETVAPTKQSIPPPYQKPIKPSIRPPLIPSEDETVKQEGILVSIGKLFVNTGVSVMDLFGGMFSGSKRKLKSSQYQHQYQQQQQQQQQENAWPMQESFVICDEDEPPTLETLTPTPRKTYAFMSRESEKTNHFWLGRNYYNGWEGEFHRTQQQHRHQQQHQHRHYSSGPRTYYEQSCEATNEIVFGAVQEEDGRRKAVEIKAVDYGDPMYNHHNIRA